MPRFSKRRSSRRIHGGVGAAEHAERVYGSAGNQHADPNNGNVIATKQVTTGGSLCKLEPANYVGGKKRKSYKRKSCKSFKSKRSRRNMKR